MKLFDYKLILMIALTFVIYFMYRELQSLNQRIENIEQTVKEVPLKLKNNQPKFINLNKANDPIIEHNIDNQLEHNVDNQLEHNIDNQLEHNVDNQLEHYVDNQFTLNNNVIQDNKLELNNILPNNSCSISTEDEDSEEIMKMNRENIMETEDAVEIYSNDNIEDISSQKTSSIEENTMIIQNNNQFIVNELVNDINLSTSSIDIEDILANNDYILLEQKDMDVNNDLEQKDMDVNNDLEQKIDQHISDEGEETKTFNSAEDLVKNKKLNELKDIANQLQIELRSNGKAKTKRQLAADIYNIQNTQ